MRLRRRRLSAFVDFWTRLVKGLTILKGHLPFLLSVLRSWGMSDEEDYESDAAEGDRYHEMKDFIIEDDEEEEDPEEPSWDSALDNSLDSTRRID